MKTSFLETVPDLDCHVVERDGCPIHVWTGGREEGPWFVMLHGATMDHRMFNAQVEALAPHVRLLVWDARAHGRSQPIGAGFSIARCTHDLLAVLDALSIDTAVVCGQSLGGYIAQELWRAAPQRVDALVLIGTTPLFKAYSGLEVFLLRASLPLFRIWPYGSLTRTIARQTAVTPAARAYALQACRQLTRADFLTVWEAVSLAVDRHGREDVAFDLPVLLLHGDQDRTGTIRRDMPRWAPELPRATYQVIPDAGHNANQDNPDATNAAILRFVQQAVR
nr:putative hydrolase [uncultured bacterium]